MDGWVKVLRPFQQYFSHFETMEGWAWKVCATKRRLGSGRISPTAGFEPTSNPTYPVGQLTLCVCVYSGLTSLSTIFQSYHDGVWLRQGAQCSLL